MVSILPQKTNIGNQIGQAIGGGFQSGLSDYLGQALKNKFAEQEARLANQLKMEAGEKRAQALQGLAKQIFGGGSSGGLEGVDFSALSPEDILKFGDFASKRQEEKLKREERAEDRVFKKEERDLTRQQKEEERETKARKPAEDYLGEIRGKYQRSQSLDPVFDELEDVVRRGGASALTAGNMADVGKSMGGFLGGTLNLIGKAQESGDTGRFRSLSKRLLDEMKDIFGGQIRVKELEVFLSMIPEIGKSKAANLASIDTLRQLSHASRKYYDTAEKIIEENGGKTPPNLAELVQKRIGPEMQSLAANLNNTLKQASKDIKAEEKGVRRVEKGTKLSQEKALEILRAAKGDKEKARKMAKDMGFEF